ncbi:MAG: hypothetical protein ACKO0M_03625 [Cyanobium sp.]
MILLETHGLLRLDRDDASFGVQARVGIAEACEAGRAAVSAVSVWQAALPDQPGRIALGRPTSPWRSDGLVAGLQELPLDGATALLGGSLKDSHADPADRFITATALRQQACLLTADHRILAWPGTLQRTPADT